MVQTVFDQLTSGDLPGPRVLADELGPAVQARQLQLWSAHPDEAVAVRAGSAPTGSVKRDSVDSFGVVTQNFDGNKIDWFLHRDIDYQADVGPEDRCGVGHRWRSPSTTTRRPAACRPRSSAGAATSPSARRRWDGENFMQVSLYTTFPIESVTVDGQAVDFTPDEELGHHMALFYLSVPVRGAPRS